MSAISRGSTPTNYSIHNQESPAYDAIEEPQSKRRRTVKPQELHSYKPNTYQPQKPLPQRVKCLTADLQRTYERVRNTSPTTIVPMLSVHRKDKLGEGSFAEVYKGKYQGIEIAVKTTKPRDKYSYSSLKREASNIRKIQENDPTNPHILYPKETLDGGKTYSSIYPLMKKDLYKDLNIRKKRREAPRYYRLSDISIIAISILRGLRALENKDTPENSLIHMDIKPENTMISDERVIKIGDFGSSCTPEALKLHLAHDYKLTSRLFRAPEVSLTDSKILKGKIVRKQEAFPFPLTSKIDVFALGCILYEIYTGNSLISLPEPKYAKKEDYSEQKYSDLSHQEGLVRYFGTPYGNTSRQVGPLSTGTNPELRDFIQKSPLSSQRKKELMSICPKKIHPIEDLPLPIDVTLQEKQQITQFKDLLRKMLEFDPTKRISVEEALEHPFVLLSISKK